MSRTFGTLFSMTCALFLGFSLAISQVEGGTQSHGVSTSLLPLDSVVADVSQESLITTVKQLSGALPLRVGGTEYTIATRYAPTEGNEIARGFISENMARYRLQVDHQQYAASSGDPSHSYTSMSFSPDKRKGWLCTSRGEILITSDSGTTWITKRPPTGSSIYNSLYGVWYVNQSTVYALAGIEGLFVKTTDGGKSWESIPMGATFISDLFVVDREHIWAVGQHGVILKTTDRGDHWQQKLLAGDPTLLQIYFVDYMHAIILGVHELPFPQQAEARLYETHDGGATWAQVPGDWGETLYCIQFLNTEFGWIAGTYGTVLRTTDGGNSWIKETLSDSTLVIIDVFFLDSSNGWVTTSGGGIYHTSDGGHTWMMQDPRTGAYTIMDIFFFNRNLGIAVGTGETRLRTDDGGQTWVNLTEMRLQNVIGTLQGKTYADRYYLLCAHMDAISGAPWDLAPGTDDNASGVAAVLEAARVLRNYEFDYTIKFVTFPDEEVSMRGSTINAQQASWGGQSLLGVINVDMIGYDGNGDRAFTLFSGTDSASNVLGNKVVESISNCQINLLPYKVENEGPSDALSYWAAGYPAVLLIEDMYTDFNPTYHTTADTWEKIDPVYLENITKAALATLVELAGLRGPVLALDESEELPEEFKLSRNYPNPFNPSTTIQYELPSSGFVSLTIYSILGERVATLVEQNQEAARYQAEWNAGDRSTGVYFYRLYVGPAYGRGTDPFLETKKMVLVK